MAIGRAIVGFHRDVTGDWVAELACWHNQHVRHRPPFEVREWVLAEATRRAHLATLLECPLCERGELPEGLTALRRLGPFEEQSMPSRLRSSHSLPIGRWGLLHVERGRAGLVFHEPPLVVVLSAGEERAIPPGLEHHLEPAAELCFAIDLLVRSSERLPQGA